MHLCTLELNFNLDYLNARNRVDSKSPPPAIRSNSSNFTNELFVGVLFFHFETHFEVGESFRHEQYRRPRLDPTASSLAVIDNSRSRAILIKRRIQVAHLSASTPLFFFFSLSFPFRRCMKICALVYYRVGCLGACWLLLGLNEWSVGL
jgi:hypothetical protein